MDRVMVLKGFREYAPIDTSQRVDEEKVDPEDLQRLMEGFEEL